MTCPHCGTVVPAGARFCGGCGSALGRVCDACGTTNDPSMRFCTQCGTPFDADAAPSVAIQAPDAERRLVSVLFADLVGFTSVSETRDAEEVRELLSAYFETCRRLIARYGGTVEKFIGDAVMAVWGAPIAQEDDAERAVRAALDLVAAVPELDPALRARGGVLTGEAAVTLRAEGQGMVAGDLVNTASRVQSAAEPGTVFVGEATKRATEAAVAYEDVGSFELKGKTEPVRLFRARRVTAGVGGAQKSVGLEAPFVGRDRELRLLKELFHASADERRAQLVSTVGVGGIGKSRLMWEFYKYIDGLSELVLWHRGRCLAYGEGVAFWALAEMIRMRTGIAEGEQPESSRVKLRASVDEYVDDPDERRFVEPRLANLLGIEERGSHGKEELFGAWRLFFERMAQQSAVALVFEDLQWADESLVEFVGYLLEWSRNHPIFVLCLARPELQQRQPEFGRSSRNQVTISLEPLPSSAMEELLDGYVPGLPDDLRSRILGRAEGVPLYAVETVRMLLDRGLLAERDGVYRPVGEIDRLDVPETLHGLIAARLDGLEPLERLLLQDGAVLGKTFTVQGLAALSERPEPELTPVLAGLVRKEVLSVQSDPRSPERGQYGFLQDLVRRVAYDTLARRDRKARHLAAAGHLAGAFGAADLEVVEVVASHYLAAYDTQPEAEDAGEIRQRALEMLGRAGERAASLAAVGEARRYFEQAAALADAPSERAVLLERAGAMALLAAEFEPAEQLAAEALDLLVGSGETHAAARVAAQLSAVETATGRFASGIERMQRAFAELKDDEPDEDIATLAARLGRLLAMTGRYEEAVETNEFALLLGESLRLPEAIVRSLGTKAILARRAGHPEEQEALLRHALHLARQHDLSTQTFSSYGNLSDCFQRGDRYAEALELLTPSIALARRFGDRLQELFALSESTYALSFLGRWDEAVATFEELPAEQLRTNAQLSSPLAGVFEVLLHRGELEEARALFAHYGHLRTSEDLQSGAEYAGAAAALAVAEGHPQDALAAWNDAAALIGELGYANQGVKQAFVWVVEAALALGEQSRVGAMLEGIEELAPGLRPPFLDAQTGRFRARLGDGDVDAQFRHAVSSFRELDMVFWAAVTQLEQAEWLLSVGRGEDAAAPLVEARDVFQELGAQPWLDRLDSASPPGRQATLAS